MYYVKVEPKINDEFMSITLLDILKKIENIENYQWAIYELYAVANRNKNVNINIPQLEAKIANSLNGLIVTSEFLLNLAQTLDYVVELILVASKEKDNFVKFKDNLEWRDKFEIVVEIVDGSYWEIYSKSKILINNLKSLTDL